MAMCRRSMRKRINVRASLSSECYDDPACTTLYARSWRDLNVHLAASPRCLDARCWPSSVAGPCAVRLYSALRGRAVLDRATPAADRFAATRGSGGAAARPDRAYVAMAGAGAGPLVHPLPDLLRSCAATDL